MGLSPTRWRCSLMPATCSPMRRRSRSPCSRPGLPAGRPTPQRSFGYRRAEILAALANGVALVVVAIWIFVEAARRFSDPPDVAGGWVLVVGGSGSPSTSPRRGCSTEPGAHSLNVRGCAPTRARRSLGLGRRDRRGARRAHHRLGARGSTRGAADRRADPRQRLAAAERVGRHPARGDARRDGRRGRRSRRSRASRRVVEVHDLHVWTITSGFPALSAHVLVEPGADCHAIRRQIEAQCYASASLSSTRRSRSTTPGCDRRPASSSGGCSDVQHVGPCGTDRAAARLDPAA